MKKLILVCSALIIAACGQSTNAETDQARTIKYVKLHTVAMKATATLQEFLKGEQAKCAPKVLNLTSEGILICVDKPVDPPVATPPPPSPVPGKK